ncbi:TIGR01777 family protein [Chitinophaga polysaccharea]|uniref:TIGR01777 family oxidoreductase n=1 Tax=Chitinophaga polysaccharea TaxID=1293035 RepID=UPI00145585E2|nr:TIGR01777 family oxidoreductase [Chitinophaga polysaccharea]NLR56571.1 TIGR01777 family protein [Chitinophaga polysaccharea]
MENKRIIIAAGTGFIGKSLATCFGKHNDIIILTRQVRPATGRISYVQWDGKKPGTWCEALEGADLLINLTGKSVNCRYNTTNKRIVLESRVNATRALGAAIRTLKNPPAVWINASSATIYRHAEDRPMDEFNGEIANDFSVQVCTQWEQAFNDITLPCTRKIVLRIGITLGWESGGVMQPYLRLVKFGLGGYQGHGRQMYTWIHITDVCRIIEWLYENDHSEGVYNCTAPFPVTNRAFMKTLREAASHPFGLPAPVPLLKIGALLIGTETELLLKSRWVLPSRSLQEGFVFAFPEIKAACEDILAHLPRSAYHLY